MEELIKKCEPDINAIYDYFPGLYDKYIAYLLKKSRNNITVKDIIDVNWTIVKDNRFLLNHDRLIEICKEIKEYLNIDATDEEYNSYIEHTWEVYYKHAFENAKLLAIQTILRHELQDTIMWLYLKDYEQKISC